jgi:2'-5' RNA ligase
LIWQNIRPEKARENPRRMPNHAIIKLKNHIAALCLSLAALFGAPGASMAQQNAVTAIDVALEPDATMIQHAKAINARLRKAYPEGFALDATHNPHITLLQQFVRTADLDKLYVALEDTLASERPTSWKLRAVKNYYLPWPPIGVAGIVIEPSPDLLRLQQKIIDAVAPFAAKGGSAAAFMSTEQGRDIQDSLIDYVGRFVEASAGKKFNPHVTTGVATEAYLNEMLAEPFAPFAFSPASASVYQLGTYGTARKELKNLVLKR